MAISNSKKRKRPHDEYSLRLDLVCLFEAEHLDVLFPHLGLLDSAGDRDGNSWANRTYLEFSLCEKIAGTEVREKIAAQMDYSGYRVR